MAKVGYARVSTDGQDVALQVDALKAAGCERIFTETASGAQRDRPELARALDYMRKAPFIEIIETTVVGFQHEREHILFCSLHRPCGNQLYPPITGRISPVI